MKKIYFLLSIMLVFSCSSETDNKQESTTSNSIDYQSRLGNVELKQLYQNMIESKKHIELSRKIDNFIIAMNYSGDEHLLDTEENIFGWISQNISSTHFANYNEATTNWNEIKNIQATVINENFSFFNGLIEANPGDLALVMNPIATPVTNGDCMNNCINGAVDCNRISQANYDGGMAAVARLTTYYPALAPVAAAIVLLKYQYSQKACVATLNACVADCEK